MLQTSNFYSNLLDNSDLVLDYELGGRESQNTKNIFVKKNEPGCYGIGSDRISDFNEQVIKIEVYDVKTKKDCGNRHSGKQSESESIM